MQKNKVAAWSIAALLAIIVLLAITSYNTLVKKDERVKLQWAEVQSTYQRRLDLIPNLVNVVKGMSGFEQGTLEKIAEARSRALSSQTGSEPTPENFNRLQTLQDSVAAAANRLIIVVEKYPTLKGTKAYAGLQTQLEGTERRIKVARNDFNAAVADYNNAVRRFPANLFAGLFGFRPKEGFAAGAGAEKTVEIKF